MRIILASKSPRRKAFMEMLGMEFEVIVSDVDESEAKKEITDPVELAKTLAKLKAEDVAKRVKEEDQEDAVVIGSDTLVSFDEKIIGKARDAEDAVNVLKGYCGKEHAQVTGICLINTRTGKVIVDHDETVSRVRELSDREIQEYVDTGEPLQGAGCYTPKAHPMLFDRIDGSWTNVVGLPMSKFVPLLGKAMRG